MITLTLSVGIRVQPTGLDQEVHYPYVAGPDFVLGEHGQDGCRKRAIGATQKEAA